MVSAYEPDPEGIRFVRVVFEALKVFEMIISKPYGCKIFETKISNPYGCTRSYKSRSDLIRALQASIRADKALRNIECLQMHRASKVL